MLRIMYEREMRSASPPARLARTLLRLTHTPANGLLCACRNSRSERRGRSTPRAAMVHVSRKQRWVAVGRIRCIKQISTGCRSGTDADFRRISASNGSPPSPPAHFLLSSGSSGRPAAAKSPAPGVSTRVTPFRNHFLGIDVLHAIPGLRGARGNLCLSRERVVASSCRRRSPCSFRRLYRQSIVLSKRSAQRNSSHWSSVGISSCLMALDSGDSSWNMKDLFFCEGVS
jgi:hypothetical protein